MLCKEAKAAVEASSENGCWETEAIFISTCQACHSGSRLAVVSIVACFPHMAR